MRARLLAPTAALLTGFLSGCDPQAESAVAEAPVPPATAPREQSVAPPDSVPPLTIALTPDSARYYPWIVELQSAPIEWVPLAPEDEERGDVVHGTRWRFIVTRSEIYVAINLEQVTLGMEGCCMELAVVRTLDMDTIARHFGLRGELSRLDELAAVSSRGFRFVLNGLPLSMVILSADSARVVRVAPR